jgi:hypothetical protein
MSGKPRKVSDSTKTAFKVLRSKGLVPKDWRVSELTEYKQKQIRAKAKEFQFVIDNPKAFTSRKVSEKTAADMARSGYKTAKVGKQSNRVILPTRGVDRQQIKGGKLVIHRKRRIETVYLTGGIDLLESLAERMNETELPPNTYWTLKVGGNMTFIENQFQSIEETIDYYYMVEAYLPESQKGNLQLVKVELLD